jgi:hypothetical protein
LIAYIFECKKLPIREVQIRDEVFCSEPPELDADRFEANKSFDGVG